MKKSKLIIAALLLCATVGAYASAVSHVQSIAYYISDQGTCELFSEEYPCLPGEPTCSDPSVPALNQQLFQSNVPSGGSPCSVPLEAEI